jgi:glucose-1-phosphate cytidylyltransferase
MTENKMIVHKERVEPWQITLIDTGDDSMTGGRLKRVAPFLCNEECFCFTYGDGLSDINIKSLIEFHKAHGKEATLTSVFPPGRFGALEIEDSIVKQFQEKPRGDGALINGGYFVLSPKVFDRIKDDSTIWEQEPLKGLAKDNQLMAYKHSGFWQPMDTLRDKIYLENLLESKKAPWKIWEE